MILAYRQKTQCKQYVFDNLEQCFTYFRKKCYWMELIKIIEYDDSTNREIRRFTHRNKWS